MTSVFRFPATRMEGELERPQLELSGPLLNSAFTALVAGTEAQGGVETWIDALKLKSRMFRQALQDSESQAPTLDSFKCLCAFMASVRRRVGPWLEQPAYGGMAEAIVELLAGAEDTTTADDRLRAFCERFPADREHRWVRDLATEILHQVDPERYPLMNRWVWDARTNTGVIREIWYGDDVDHISIPIGDGYGTYLMLREELSQFLSANGVFRDVIWYVDLLCAQVYAGYIASQGSVYLRADFSAPGDPMEHARRMLGLDGVRADSGRTRLKPISGEAHVLDDAAVTEN
ncbi:MAG: hypothetical protein GTN86_02750 [Xanthomonadales bacterium]|nr:hypothetical protein [Xanthomonadales bacterium]NIN58938.1 hypothetical protein [Xanthomonadales bacterium]NIN74207.1 hypothetical protein [Xanthomonadales bacterium]NIO13878.1 hypothetical protein [Xanthomonadales bacterium]NIP11331.1 hypothetical protein [Xanthomonadales bacterium]